MRGLLSDCAKHRGTVVHRFEHSEDTVCSCVVPVAELHLWNCARQSKHARKELALKGEVSLRRNTAQGSC